MANNNELHAYHNYSFEDMVDKIVELEEKVVELEDELVNANDENATLQDQLDELEG